MSVLVVVSVPVDYRPSNLAMPLKDELGGGFSCSTSSSDDYLSCSPRQHTAAIVLGFVKEKQADGQIEFISMVNHMNGGVPWTRIEFSCHEACSETLVEELAHLGIGGHSRVLTAAQRKTWNNGAGIVNILPLALQRLGSRPKSIGSTTDAKAIHVGPNLSTPQSFAGLLNKSKSLSDIGSPASSVSLKVRDESYCAETQEPVALEIVSGSDGEKKRGTIGGASKTFIESIKSRIALDSLVEVVHAGAAFSFDYVMLVTIASILACIGLLENNGVIIVASMLVSPLMGPILGVTFGTVSRDWRLVKKGLFGELMGVVIAILVGFVGTLCAAPFIADHLPQREMITRADIEGLIVGVAIAIPSGMGVALSVLGRNAGSLVGVAISASLLPPAVNTGCLFALAALIAVDYEGVSHITTEFLKSQLGGNVHFTADSLETLTSNNMLNGGLVSLTLTAINIVCIWIFAIFMFMIKQVAPSSGKEAWFWKKHLRGLRGFYIERDNSETPDPSVIFNKIKQSKRHLFQDGKIPAETEFDIAAFTKGDSDLDQV